jgi:hypothetical protein
MSSPSVAATAVPGAISARLVVADRGAAETTLATALQRLGGTVVSRRSEGDATLVELTVPGAAYPELVRELERLGRFTPERVPAELPERVRVTLRLSG